MAANSNTKDKAAKPETIKKPGLAVVARTDGFRRANKAWPRTETKVLKEELTEQQIKDLKNEPELIVRDCQITVPAPIPTETNA